jgi:hypothetical protein
VQTSHQGQSPARVPLPTLFEVCSPAYCLCSRSIGTNPHKEPSPAGLVTGSTVGVLLKGAKQIVFVLLGMKHAPADQRSHEACAPEHEAEAAEGPTWASLTPWGFTHCSL